MKVAIIGAGDVGGTCAMRIAEADLADIILLDIVKGKAEAVALDLSSAASIIRHSRTIIGTTDYQDIAGAEIVVITAGRVRQPGQNRVELLIDNAQIVKDVAQHVANFCPGAVVIVVTNPLDLMTYLTLKTTNFSPNQIIGMGGVSDCARFNMLVAAELETKSRLIQSVIIGPHSEEMLILPRLSTVLGTAITEILPQDRIARLVEETRNFGARIVQLLGQGSACYGPSAGVFSLVDAVINDRKEILCVSAYLVSQYDLKDLCIGVPAKIGRMGIEEIIELKLSQQEKENFLQSAEDLKDLIKNIGV